MFGFRGFQQDNILVNCNLSPHCSLYRTIFTFTIQTGKMGDHPDSIRNDTDSKTLTRLVMVRTRNSDLVILLNSIQTACKLISRSVRKAGIAGLCEKCNMQCCSLLVISDCYSDGTAGTENATGDSQKKLDVLSNDMFVNSLYNSHQCAVLVSEENEEPIIVEESMSGSSTRSMAICHRPCS